MTTAATRAAAAAGATASPTPPTATPPANDLTFGEAMARLEEIVTQLEESEELGLEQALALYEQGATLAGDCRQRLAAAKLRLTEIAVSAPAGDE
jgi:exodeoxyribonuclease VII small subunit